MLNEQNEALNQLMGALLIITTEERLWLFSDQLFNKAYDLYEYIFYLRYQRR